MHTKKDISADTPTIFAEDELQFQGLKKEATVEVTWQLVLTFLMERGTGGDAHGGGSTNNMHNGSSFTSASGPNSSLMSSLTGAVGAIARVQLKGILFRVVDLAFSREVEQGMIDNVVHAMEGHYMPVSRKDSRLADMNV